MNGFYDERQIIDPNVNRLASVEMFLQTGTKQINILVKMGSHWVTERLGKKGLMAARRLR